MTLSTNQLAKNFTSGADEKSYRSRQEKSVASVCCSKSKENALENQACMLGKSKNHRSCVQNSGQQGTFLIIIFQVFMLTENACLKFFRLTFASR